MIISNVIIDFLKIITYVVYLKIIGQKQQCRNGTKHLLAEVGFMLGMLPGAALFLLSSFLVIYRISVAMLYLRFFNKRTALFSMCTSLLAYAFMKASYFVGVVLSYPLILIGHISLHTFPAEACLILMQFISACMIGMLLLKCLPISVQRISKGAQIGITLVCGVIEFSLTEFESGTYDSELTILYKVLFAFTVFSILIMILWLLDKHEEQKKIQDLISYSHRTREVLPTLGRVLDRLDTSLEDNDNNSQLLEELRSICETDQSRSRKEAANIKTFNTTGIIVLDEQFKRYLEEAEAQEFELDIIAVAPASEVINNGSIDRFELLQLIGDLYRNAFSAIQKVDDGRILICLGYNNEKIYEISIYDNGLPFPKHILSQLGRRGVTTEGTGHGIADVFQVLESEKISFKLNQKLSKNSIFTKGIYITFDGLGRKDIIC